jgi:hypothetical protein
MAMRQEFRVPENISELSPEEQEKWRQREREYKQRLTKEDLMDQIYEQKQKSKMLKELQEGKKERPVKKLTTEEQKEKERRMTEEFLAKQRGEEKVKEEEEKKLEEIMSDPSIMEQKPKDAICVNQIGEKPCGRPATMMLSHGGLLGDTPPITLCQYCSKFLSLTPLTDEAIEEQYMQSVIELDELEESRRSKLVDYGRQRLEDYKKRLREAEELKSREKSPKRKKSNTSYILQKIAELAGKLDAKGLHDEANLLDKILRR